MKAFILELLDFKEPCLLSSNVFKDNRGSFTKIWQGKYSWVKQINISKTRNKGTVRGIHSSFSRAELKMITCLSGKILDIAVNLRENDKEFGKVYYKELSDASQSFVIPLGYGHGFQALSDNCTILYHHNITYDPKDQANLSLASPLFAIKFPLVVSEISHQDATSIKIINKEQFAKFVK